ncbi:MAG TPA: zinc ABC transporter substrate-binding protein [Verrucomicrobiae bacterium]|nr:zinc ABC transporter substrate-binding protein [Verrucomicrobiae bacterium]
MDKKVLIIISLFLAMAIFITPLKILAESSNETNNNNIKELNGSVSASQLQKINDSNGNASINNYSNKYSTNLKSNTSALISISNNTGLQSNLSKPLLKVVASFFPIYEFVKAVGGDRIQASVLIPVGIEPHDFDPTIQEIRDAQNADMVVYNGAGMESSWINKINPKFAVDTSQGLRLLSSNEKEAITGTDPHIWLDPILAKQQVNNIVDGLIKIDPSDASYYKTNAQKFIAQLTSLDSSIKSGLSNCNLKDFISFHNAFTYFAQRYGLIQHNIQGLSPEGEILPQKIQEIIQLANKLGINTIYSEDMVDPRATQVIADEIPNGKVVVLSPIEGIKQQEQKLGIGYLDKMKENLHNLEEGLQCKSRI